MMKRILISNCKLTLHARSLLAEGKTSEAADLIAIANGRATTVEDFPTRIIIAITDARVRTARGQKTEAKKLLEQSVVDARKAGLLELQFEALLALGETEMNGGDLAVGRSALKTLQRDAKGKGFELVARKAAAAAKATKRDAIVPK
jgi:ATP/maltotriose-dependent transcriptional regulator MalT